MPNKMNRNEDYILKKEDYNHPEYESELSNAAERKPRDVLSWIVARQLSGNEFMRGYYLKGMLNCIRKNDKINDYLKGIVYTRDSDRETERKELIRELLDKHPLLGRLSLPVIIFMPRVFHPIRE